MEECSRWLDWSRRSHVRQICSCSRSLGRQHVRLVINLAMAASISRTPINNQYCQVTK